MSGGAWFELWPDGQAVGGAERYGDRAAAEQAATAMLIRRPDLAFVDIAKCGESSLPHTISRISGTQPPVPAAGEVDGLHLLPRGEPEC
jgi:hypothetical protein